ncbi:MAG: regulatory protein LuxR [Acidimicrobiaceae bacterium]|nr:MAG: regulatory protein LuxR [Acidimicrobiaceae bacterium]
MRIVIAEDSVLLREGITRLLAEYGHEVVAAEGDASRLLDVVLHHAPDLVIVDVRMPPAAWPRAAPLSIPRWWRSCWPEAAVAIRSTR